MDRTVAQWRAEGSYFDTASYGLPPVATTDRLNDVLDSWSRGVGVWETWSEATDRAREIFASIVGVPADSVMTGASLSQMVSIVATAIPDGSKVLSTDIEFTSNLFPYLALERRGVTVRTVPTNELAAAIEPGIQVVACPAVQSATGQVVDLETIKARCHEVGAFLIVDGTQAAGWLPIDLNGIDAYLCSGYKWLMCPRGVAFGVLSERIAANMIPLAANWYGGAEVHSSYYGPPLRLTSSARRFDLSPAWFSWVGAVESLSVIEKIGHAEIHHHDLAVANAFSEGAGLGATSSAIVSIGVAKGLDPTSLPFRASIRDGGLRLSFHLYCDEAEARVAGEYLRPHIAR
jgi:selenocysteine lyase/cysteine desulfurase